VGNVQALADIGRLHAPEAQDDVDAVLEEVWSRKVRMRSR